MDIRVLGPVELWHDGAPVALARRQQRLVLGILALEANRLVSSDRLIDQLWGDAVPPRGRAVLQTRISELRSVLAQLPDVELATYGAGYVLRVDPQFVDAHRFRCAVAGWRDAGSDQLAREALRGALELWRGPVLGGGLPEPAHSSLCQGLESARSTALEDLFEIELRLGAHAEVVDDVVAACAANPTRERLLGQAMVALQRTGRAVEALQVYDRRRRWLRDELGVDPGAEVQQVYLALLAGENEGWDEGADWRGAADQSTSAVPQSEPAVASGFVPAVPQVLPPDIADFTGRVKEVGLLRDALTRPSGGGPVVVAVTGQGGVGKTTLCVRVAHGVRDRFPDGQLYIDLRGVTEDVPVAPTEALARFLRALGVDGSGMPDGEAERVDLYRDLLAERRVLVVLDNAASDDQVLPLIPSGPGTAVLINSRARVGSTFGVDTLDLEVLDPSQSMDLLTRLAGAQRVTAERAAAEDLCRQCGNLPLAIRIAAAKLRVKPHWALAKLVDSLRDERKRLDRFAYGHLDVRASISLSYAGLDPEARRLLRRIGDIDLPEMSVWLSTALLDTSPEVAEEILERLFDAQLLEVAGQDPTGHARYRMHDLVRLFARERAEADETADEVEATRTRAYGAWLYLAQQAYRAVWGGDHHNILGPTPRWPVDAVLTNALLASPTAWFEIERLGIMATIRRAARDGRAGPGWEIACTTYVLFEMRRYFDDCRSTLESALAVAQEASDARGVAAIHYRLGDLLTNRVEFERSRGHYATAMNAFDLAGDIHGRTIVALAEAAVDYFNGNDDIALKKHHQALAIVRGLVDHGGQAFALRRICQIHLRRGSLETAAVYLEQVFSICQSQNLVRSQAQAHYLEGLLRLSEGNVYRSAAAFLTARDMALALGDQAGVAQSLRGLGTCYHRQGDVVKAKATLSEALDLMRQPRKTYMEDVIRQSIIDLDLTIQLDEAPAVELIS
ncbi:MAG TPA: BTAD domain-containing putative transcriptional regulator [Micromonosporaceae bacterium]|nr:BTAD domain-containing putative transcriptional regulator [Micromonosporaceae bacterium]